MRLRVNMKSEFLKMYRNRKLLDLAHNAPCFLQIATIGCGEFPSVPCHSDMQRHGRGVGHKSGDEFAVPGCPKCHTLFTREHLGRDGYEWKWQIAHDRYLSWLFTNNKLEVKNG